MAEKQKKSASRYFYVPDVSLFLEGNDYISSENTFNLRISPSDDRLKVQIWYGMKCFGLSEIVDEFDADKNADGLVLASEHIDSEYEKYLKKLDSGEVKGRRTYVRAEKKENT